MNQLFIILSVILVIGVIVYLFVHYRSEAVVLRTLKRLPYQRLGSLRTNAFSKIEGKALNIEEPLIAPYSKRKCVFYQILIEQRVQRGKHSYWKTIVDQEKIQDFFIEQKGERCVVLPVTNPRNFIAYLNTDRTKKSGVFNDPTPEFESLLRSFNIETKGLLGFNKRLRYKEAIVEVGERITIAGKVKWMDLENNMADYAYSSIASLYGGEGKDKLIITDSTKAFDELKR